MSSIFLAKSIELQVSVSNAEEAIRKAGGLLVKSDYATNEFVEDMVKVYNELGSYIVIAPGLALPHARPEAGAKQNGFSLITLKNPIYFGHRTNDPVRVVIGMSAINNNAHVKSLMILADKLGEEGIINQVADAKTAEQIVEIFKT